MCSIFGVLGPVLKYDSGKFLRLHANAGDRGRDGVSTKLYRLGGTPERMAVLGNWRATPTPEIEHAPLQPYDGVVHNGTIANDKELGALYGEVDSMVLPRVLDRSSAVGLAASLEKVKGSYAIGVETGVTVLLARNYKPLYWAELDGMRYFSSMARHFHGVLPPGHAPVEVEPYSVLNLGNGAKAFLEREWGNRALVIASAGLDSTTVAGQLLHQGHQVALIHFRYGCRAEANEVARIKAIAAHFKCDHVVIDVDYRAMCLAKGALFGGEIASGIEGAEFAHEWVPARNLVMLSLAVAYAEANGYHTIALGNNLEESGAYPDNEEEFTGLFNHLLPYAVHDGYGIQLEAPVGHLMKHEIVAKGLELDIPYHLTWSCYRGGEKHCGRCGPCFMRRTAFRRNGKEDPVEYDTDT